MAAPRRRGRQFVQSLERGLAVIRALSLPGQGRTLSEVARDTGPTRASARRFLLTLEELGYVRSGGRVVAAMNLSTQANRRTPAAIRRELLPPLQEAAAAIAGDLVAGRVP